MADEEAVRAWISEHIAKPQSVALAGPRLYLTMCKVCGATMLTPRELDFSPDSPVVLHYRFHAALALALGLLPLSR